MRKISTIFCALAMFFSFAQESVEKEVLAKLIDLGNVTEENENFETFAPLKELLKDAEIVMLGEQSHGEATTYETKIKLVKYLHEELGYDMLAFESGFYDCHKAWEQIQAGENIRESLGRSVFSIWSTMEEFKPLVNYIDKQKNSDNPLIIKGFDSQLFSITYEKHFMNDLKKGITSANANLLQTQEWKFIEEHLSDLLSYDKSKKIEKEEVLKSIATIDKFIANLEKEKGQNDLDFWIQVLKSAKIAISDISLKTDKRDYQMAQNLIWLKNKYPDKKIICWGATSHFIYNTENVQMRSPIVRLLGGNYYKKNLMMGDYIKKKYKDKVFVIGFTAYEGVFGAYFRKKIKVPKEQSIEYLIGKSEYTNCLLPLRGESFESYLSRPLGNYYMKNDIAKIMDAVIFNRSMRRPRTDAEFFHKMYPQNTYFAKIVQKRKEAAQKNEEDSSSLNN